MLEYLDLDQEAATLAGVVVSFRGLKMAITRERLVHLLQLEQAVLAGGVSAVRQSEASTEAAPAAKALVAPAAIPRPAPAGDDRVSVPRGGFKPNSITHASLSARIRRIYEYSVTQQKLRPAHVGLLSELIACFDWKLPTYPNTKLDNQLHEMTLWHGAPDELKRQISEFLVRYKGGRRKVG